MPKKLKNLSNVLSLINAYLNTREKNDIKKALVESREYQNLSWVIKTLKNVQNVLESSKEDEKSITKLDLDLNPQIDLIVNSLDTFADREEFKKEKTKIENYTISKNKIISDLLEEDVEEITGTAIGYYSSKINIVNVPSQTIGRFHSISMRNTPTSGKYDEKYIPDAIYLCNNIIPVIENTIANTLNYFYLTCSGDYLYKDNVWNKNCINFLHKKFSAKKSVTDLLDYALTLPISGDKPDWVCDYEMMQ